MTDQIRQGDFDAFFRVPFEIYRDRPYVSPMRSDLRRFLDPAQNPLFERADDLALFTCHRDGRLLGRITAHVHRESNRRHGQNMAWFGYFDCADDAPGAAALLAAAEDWARARGFDSLTGNFNMTAMQMIGVMTDGFDHAPYSDQVWGPPWLPGLLERNGYARFFPMVTHEAVLPDWAAQNPPPHDLPHGLFHVPITRRTLPERLEESRRILNARFAENPMFVPLTPEEYAFQAKDLKWILDPRLSVVLHDDQGAAAALLCIPDVNPMLRAMRSRLGLLAPWHMLRHRLTNRRAVIIFYGVRPDLQRRGITPYMVDLIFRRAHKAGYDRIGGTWIADENPASLRQAEKQGLGPRHRLHLFRKAL